MLSAWDVSKKSLKSESFSWITAKTIDISDAKKDSEKSTDRQYLIRKVKNGAGHIDVPVSDVYDLTKLTASISKGLLTVKIPKAESKKAQEYTIA